MGRTSNLKYRYLKPSLIIYGLHIDIKYMYVYYVHTCMHTGFNNVYDIIKTLLFSFVFNVKLIIFSISSNFQIKGEPMSVCSALSHFQAFPPLDFVLIYPAPIDSCLCIIKPLHQTQRESAVGRTYQLKSVR